MDFMVLFDLMIIGFGAYIVFTSYRMKQTGEISTIVMNREEIPKCRDKAGYIDFVYKKSIMFGIIAALFGALGLINDLVYAFGAIVNWIGIIVFIVMFVWFTNALRKARSLYF
ncbi:MAG: hypothetical protein ACK5ML_02605 [Lachnospiraceae bacterium]